MEKEEIKNDLLENIDEEQLKSQKVDLNLYNLLLNITDKITNYFFENNKLKKENELELTKIEFESKKLEFQKLTLIEYIEIFSSRFIVIGCISVIVFLKIYEYNLNDILPTLTLIIGISLKPSKFKSLVLKSKNKKEKKEKK